MHLNSLLKAIQDTLRKIDRFNSTIQLIKEKTPDDRLSLESHQEIKEQLTHDLVNLLANFDVNVEVLSKDA